MENPAQFWVEINNLPDRGAGRVWLIKGSGWRGCGSGRDRTGLNQARMPNS